MFKATIDTLKTQLGYHLENVRIVSGFMAAETCTKLDGTIYRSWQRDGKGDEKSKKAINKDNGININPLETDYITGCCIFTHNKNIEKLNGFKEPSQTISLSMKIIFSCILSLCKTRIPISFNFFSI